MQHGLTQTRWPSRRDALAHLAALPALAIHVASAGQEAPQRLASAWRVGSPTSGQPPDRTGVIEIDWAEGRVTLVSEHAVPSRAHGLLALPDGGYAAVAHRPGTWLLRCDAQGALIQRIDVGSERPLRTLNGHLELSADGAWAYSAETDPATQANWISVRDLRTLARVAQFESGGMDAHQLLRAAGGSLMVAHGGLVRDAAGRKVAMERMAPSLVQLDPVRGEIIGQWRLADRRLSLRHLAWSLPSKQDSQPLLGIALQAEHSQEPERQQAPALAVWDGHTLQLPCGDARANGYVGDISAGPEGGFMLSAQKAGQTLWWHPAQPQRLVTVAELTEPCALAAAQGGEACLVSAGRGVARWHRQLAPRMLRWPAAIAPDNHWVLLRSA